ncbi:MAG: PD-(D/E)XK nuclease domain-containing protein [Lachnospiraceae bacterium]|nr:PD-(D/E)XK nuclease domain-containing protein [Lachnospiraceae bacterium]
MEREDQAGIGYVDYIFYPHKRSDDGIIIELKVDDSPEKALQQIKDKDYALKFKGKMGGAAENNRKDYPGRNRVLQERQGASVQD